MYKFRSYVNIYSHLPLIFDCLRLIYNYNFLTVIQSHNIYSWHHIKWLYATLISWEFYLLGFHRSNLILSNLMFVHNMSYYVDITSIALHLLTIKKLLTSIFLKHLIASYPIYSKEYYHKRQNFSTPSLTRFTHFLIFISTVKRNYLTLLWHCQHFLRELNHLNLKNKLVGLLWHYRKFLLELNKL